MSRIITPTYILLNQITLAATTSSVTFSNIPQNYGDLVLIVSGTISGGSSVRGVELFFNANETSSNYSYVWAYGDSSGPGSASGSNQFFAMNGDASNAIVQIMDYSATDKHKTTLFRYSAGGIETGMVAGRFASTSAITSLVMKDAGAAFNLNSGTTVSLYGIAA